MNPFLNLRIQPSFGQYKAVVTWDTPEECYGGSYYIYRSYSGVKGTWEMLNEKNPVSHGISYWMDVRQSIPTAGSTIYYRMLYVAPDGREYDSDAIDMWGSLPREEYGLVHMMLFNEFFEMQQCGGIPVWYCVPLACGEIASNIDPATLQPMSVTGPDDGYGQLYKGGFAPPIQTWVKFGTMSNKSTDRDDGMGFDEDVFIGCRFLAFPRVRRGHMVVNPRTDDRYVVASNVTPFMHRGVVPTAYEANLQRLGKDYRRDFPVPPMFDTAPL